MLHLFCSVVSETKECGIMHSSIVSFPNITMSSYLRCALCVFQVELECEVLSGTDNKAEEEEIEARQREEGGGAGGLFLRDLRLQGAAWSKESKTLSIPE